MEQNFKPITKQLVIAMIILSSVTVLSLGIRRVRFCIYRADIVEPAPSDHLSDIEDQSQPKQLFNTDEEPDYYPEDSYIADAEPDPEYTDESVWNEQTPSNDYSEAQADSGKKDKSFKGDYAKVKDSKGLKKISLGNHENLYLTKDGEYWYVNDQPGGKITKMQVEIDDGTGELIAVNGGYYAKQEPQRIPIGENEDIYLTDEGQAWYVSEQPDGETVKMQVQMD